jgi:virginiamycin B lyase
MWFTDFNNPGSFGQISVKGKITIHTSSDVVEPFSITTGPGGALWIATETATKTGKGSIERIVPNKKTSSTGKVTVYTNAGIDQPAGITVGPDGALWFTNYAGNSIGRITTAGTVTIYTGKGVDAPAGITTGPDGALWFTNSGNNSIGRITTGGKVTTYT